MMKKIRELLVLIEDGNAVDILSEADLVERFNYLLKHQLIIVEDHKIILTEKGKQVKAGRLHLKGEKKKKGPGKVSDAGKKNSRYEILAICIAATLLLVLMIYWLI